MTSVKVLRRRIRSVKNTQQITKAMELVAASKLRRIQEAARQSRHYSRLAYSLLHRAAASAEMRNHPFFVERIEARRSLLVVFSSDRGLAGAFNNNVHSAALQAMATDKSLGLDVDLVLMGRRGGRYFAGLKGLRLVSVFEQLEDIPRPARLAPLMALIQKGVTENTYAKVSVITTRFESTLSQRVQNLPLLPVRLDHLPSEQRLSQAYQFEPSPESVAQQAAGLYLESQLMQARLDSTASEYAMRMLAMHNANNNAAELTAGLELELNATRQAAITQQIAEISGGVAALAD